MMTTRRQFFKLVAGAAALAAVPNPLKAAPVFHGDGVTCDADAIEALFRGEAVQFLNPEHAARIKSGPGHVFFDGIKMAVHREFLPKPDDDNTMCMIGAHFVYSQEPGGIAHLFKIDTDGLSIIKNCTFEITKTPQLRVAIKQNAPALRRGQLWSASHDYNV